MSAEDMETEEDSLGADSPLQEAIWRPRQLEQLDDLPEVLLATQGVDYHVEIVDKMCPGDHRNSWSEATCSRYTGPFIP